MDESRNKRRGMSGDRMGEGMRREGREGTRELKGTNMKEEGRRA